MGKEFTDQHIVPKCYLDRFGTKRGKKVVIGTRLNANGKVKFFPATTSDVGYIKNFYKVLGAFFCTRDRCPLRAIHGKPDSKDYVIQREGRCSF